MAVVEEPTDPSDLDPNDFIGRLQAVIDSLQDAANAVAGANNLSQYGIVWDGMDVARITELIGEIRDGVTTLKKTTGA